MTRAEPEEFLNTKVKALQVVRPMEECSISSILSSKAAPAVEGRVEKKSEKRKKKKKEFTPTTGVEDEKKKNKKSKKTKTLAREKTPKISGRYFGDSLVLKTRTASQKMRSSKNSSNLATRKRQQRDMESR